MNTLTAPADTTLDPAAFAYAWPETVSDAFRLEMFEEFCEWHARGHAYESTPWRLAKDSELSSLYQSIAYFVDTRAEVLEAWTEADTMLLVRTVRGARELLEDRGEMGDAFHRAVWAVLSAGTFENPGPLYV